MMIADVIRHAKTEHEIYFLLTAYLESIQFGNGKNFASRATIKLPLTGQQDLQQRFNQLVIDLDSASKSLDDNGCLVIKEALHIVGSALHQLRHLESVEHAKNQPLATHCNRRDSGHPPYPRTSFEHMRNRAGPQGGEDDAPRHRQILS